MIRSNRFWITLASILIAFSMQSQSAEQIYEDSLDVQIVFLEFRDANLTLYINDEVVFTGRLDILPQAETAGLSAIMAARVRLGKNSFRLETGNKKIVETLNVGQEAKYIYVDCCGKPYFQLSNSDFLLLD